MAEEQKKRIKINCPTCGTEQNISIPVDAIKNQAGICTIQIKASCGHVFDVYVDQNFKVRGFHRPDFTIIPELEKVDKEISTLIKNHHVNCDLELDKNDPACYKNYFDADGFLEDISSFYANDNLVDLYSRSSILGVVQVEKENPEQATFTPVVETPVVAASTQSSEDIKRQYDLRIQRVKLLMTENVTAETKGRLLDIKRDLDAFYKKIQINP